MSTHCEQQDWSRRRTLAALAASAVPGPAVARPPSFDDWADLTKAMNAGGARIARRDQPYRLTRPVVVSRPGSILFEAGTVIRFDGPLGDQQQQKGVIDIRSDQVRLGVIGDGELLIEALRPDPFLYAVQAGGVNDVAIAGVFARNCQHVRIFSPRSDNWRDISTVPGSRDLCRRINIRGGGARFDEIPPLGTDGACNIRFTVDWTVSGCRYENVVHGAQWWGGDANPKRDGGAQKERKCADFTIRGVTVTHARGAGIWGSMGQRGTIVDCQIEDCGDVGLDAEGSVDILFDRCRSRDARNGGLAVFFLCRNVTFHACDARSSKRVWPLFRIWNETDSSAGTGLVSVRGGTFTCTDPAGPGEMDAARGPTRELVIEGAVLDNVVIDTISNNMHATRVKGNTLTLPGAAVDRPAIRVGGSKLLDGEAGSVLVEGNRITLTGVRRAAPAIEVVEDDYNSSASGKVRANIVIGPFEALVSAVNASQNPGMRPTLVVEGNRLSASAPHGHALRATASRPGGRPPQVRWSGNTDASGAVLAP